MDSQLYIIFDYFYILRFFIYTLQKSYSRENFAKLDIFL